MLRNHVEALLAASSGVDQPRDVVKHLLAVPGRTPADAYERAGCVAALEKAKTTYGSLS